MKTATEWRNEFCNQNVINSRTNIIEPFVRDIQRDARVELLRLLDEIVNANSQNIETIGQAFARAQEIIRTEGLI